MGLHGGDKVYVRQSYFLSLMLLDSMFGETSKEKLG